MSPLSDMNQNLIMRLGKTHKCRFDLKVQTLVRKQHQIWCYLALSSQKPFSGFYYWLAFPCVLIGNVLPVLWGPEYRTLSHYLRSCSAAVEPSRTLSLHFSNKHLPSLSEGLGGDKAQPGNSDALREGKP